MTNITKLTLFYNFTRMVMLVQFVSCGKHEIRSNTITLLQRSRSVIITTPTYPLCSPVVLSLQRNITTQSSHFVFVDTAEVRLLLAYQVQFEESLV